MQTLQELERKRKSADDLHSVVRTMKSLAAVSIRQYEDSVRSLEDYYRAVELGLRAALLHQPARGRRAESPETVAIVFGSDQGMVGQFNEAIAGFAGEFVREQLAGRRLRLWAVGARVAASLEERIGKVEEVFSLPSSARAVNESVQETLLRFERLQAGRESSALVLFHHVPLSGASYRQERVPLLPPDRAWLARLGGSWPARCLPFYRLSREELLSALIGEYLFVSLFRAYASSLAAENAARLVAMDRAERNIRERKEELTARYHSLRQSSVTEELLDVMSGFEARTE